MVNPAPPRLALRVLSSTDLHGHLVGWDYYADRPNPAVGLSRLATLIAGARREAGNTLFFDNGDLLQGNPLADHFALGGGLGEGQVHPMIAALAALGCDGAVPGNHEFNYGLPFAEAVLSRAPFPVVCTNVRRGTAGGEPLFRPWTVIERRFADDAGVPQDLRIGIVGFVPPQILRWDSRNLRGIHVRDMVDAAREAVPVLRAEGADLVVALVHAGIAADYEPGEENAALELARVPGIDVLITGHQHRLFPGDPEFAGIEGVDAGRGSLRGRPAVMAGCFGSHLGVVDLVLERQAGGWCVADFAVAARPIVAPGPDGQPVAVAEDEALAAIAEPAHAATRTAMSRPVGTTTSPLFSWFALAAPDACVQIVARAQRAYAEALLEGTQWQDLPLLSAASPFKVGGRMGPAFYTDIATGPLVLRNIADLYLFPNTLCIVTATGAAVLEWLERAAGIFRQIEPGRVDQPLLHPHLPGYDFDALDGLTWTIDLAVPPAFNADGGRYGDGPGRIRSLRHAGEPVRPGQTFAVVTNNHRAGFGGPFAGLDGAKLVIAAPDTNRDAVARYIRAEGTVAAEERPTWRFRPIAGASALIEIGPGARAHAEAAAAAGLERVGPGANGFDLYRKHFP